MTLDELLYAVMEQIVEHGRDTEVTMGVGFDKNGNLECVSLLSEPYGGPAEIILEDKYLGRTAILAERGGANEI